jgi:hypothetical protein
LPAFTGGFTVADVTDESLKREPPLTEDERQRGAFMARRALEELGDVRLITSTKGPCSDCGSTEAKLFPRVNGQARVHCARCDNWLYFASKVETGELPRSVETVRRGLKPSRQARILERDQRCLLCGRTAEDVPLTVAHLVSVNDGLDAGLTDAEINDDANLAAMCESCNLGLGGRSVAATTFVRHLVVAVRAQIARRDGLPVTPLGQ